MSLADELQAAISETASTENAVNDTQFIRVTLKSINTENKAIIRRLDADADDGIAYPILADSGYLAPNSTVWAMKTHGGLVIIDRVRVSGDRGQPPIGTVVSYVGQTDPLDGQWFVCDGRAISRTTYALLFAVMGTTYGAGNGSTTFNIPDLRGRIPIGAGQGSGLATRQLGQTVGAENHTLSVAEMPSHTHTGSTDSSSHAHGGSTFSSSHSHGTDSWVYDVEGHFINCVGGSGPSVLDWFEEHSSSGTGSSSHSHSISTDTNSHSHSISLNSTGSSNAHNNMQPSLVLNYIIRVLA